MSHEARVEQARKIFENLLPGLDLPGLRLEAIGFDFIRQSFTVSLSRETRALTLVLPVERVDELGNASHFAVRRFRKEIETALDDA